MEPGDQFGILLGTDHGELQLSDAKILGQSGEPFGEHTELGWAFSGPIKNVQFLNRKMGVIGLSTVTNQVILSTMDNCVPNLASNDSIARKSDTLSAHHQTKNLCSSKENVSFIDLPCVDLGHPEKQPYELRHLSLKTMFHQLSNTMKQDLMSELTEDERASHTFNPLWFPVIDRGKKVTTTQLSKTHSSLNSPEAKSPLKIN